jgi:hypothetical protein
MAAVLYQNDGQWSLPKVNALPRTDLLRGLFASMMTVASGHAFAAPFAYVPNEVSGTIDPTPINSPNGFNRSMQH